MTKHVHRHPNSLEREIIVAVIALYLFIATVMVAVHYLQPAGQETLTSSPSPSHDSFRAKPETSADAAEPTRLEQPAVHQILTRAGYQELRGLRLEGNTYRVTAIKGGKTLDVEVDALTGAIQDAIAATH